MAASPVELGAEPPLWSNLPLDVPLLSMLTRIPSMLDWVRLVSKNTLVKLVASQLLNIFAGKFVRFVFDRQALEKSVPLDMSINGKLVKLLPDQAAPKPVPLDVFINGKLVKLLVN